MVQTHENILLASHGTAGARAAEAAAFSLSGTSTTLHHLIVVPDFWKGMMGDDWLNNASTRKIYGDYVESQLIDEIREHVSRLQQEAQRRQLGYDYEVVVGDPTTCLIDKARTGAVDIVLTGSPRPKHESGLNSRLRFDKLISELAVPLLVVPRADA
jgi:nucleotide-binding universal stress UspA family protein